jgi:Tfp pilus assembly protein PilF
MRLLLILIIPLNLAAQPEFPALDQAYSALRSKLYDNAIQSFQAAIAAAPKRSDIRKDLAYTYLKVGDPEAARNQFRQAMELDPSDQSVALEYAFLSYEARVDPIPAKALARRIFDSLRHAGNSTAERAYENVDRPLREGIDRWTKALAIGPESFSAHYELAQLAEQRDQWELASAHYLSAFQLLPARKSVLIDLARVYTSLQKPEEAVAALIAASRGGEPRSAERARELLPDRYPYVYEFRGAIQLDPSNVDLHRELAYLLLAMHDPLAEAEFRKITDTHPDDLAAVAQLGLLLIGRQDPASAVPLFERVVAGGNFELASRIRAAMQLNIMATRSFDAGFLQDALRYLNIAHESDPNDYSVILKLGWTLNMLHDDVSAIRWFDLARQSPDPEISSEATRAFENLKPSVELFRTTAWVLPFYSSRWSDVFAYGQIKSELNLHVSRIKPYVSLRLIADTKPTPENQALSERSFVLGVGVAAQWNRFTGWAEAGSAVNYTTGSMVPDYRGGVSWSRAWRTESRYFLETNADEVFVSRFGNDWLTYLQSRFGYRWLLMNANLTGDSSRQHWANFVEAGPGVRFHIPNTPKNLLLSLNFLHGVYLVSSGLPHQSSFNDLRAGFWYAITK